ncbi:hypothetical protein [Streptomyces sp. NPDC051214]|uniref:hypothetical protein n=1 Tax=Streptomyces sp. NPDC051214 TaxID=3155282 RepID=UPI00342B483B
MVKKSSTVAMLVMSLLGVSACSSGGGNGSAASRDACERVIGKPGIEWIKDNVSASEVAIHGPDTLDEARVLFQKQMKGWTPDEAEAPSFLRSEVCRVSATPKKQGEYLAIEYGASIFPFDSPFDKNRAGEKRLVEIPVNSDVKLVYGKDRLGPVHYRIYVKCGVAGAADGQEKEVPLEGDMVDTLTRDTDTRVHLEHLLRSAETVTRAFKCRNKPDIPREVPASVS